MKIVIDIGEFYTPVWKIAAGALEYETESKKKGLEQSVRILLPHASFSNTEDSDPVTWDGAIVREPRPELNIPQVLVSPGVADDYVSVTIDDEEIGRMAAAKLFSIGLSNFAFYGWEDLPSAQGRWRGFSQYLESRGMEPVFIRAQKAYKPWEVLPEIPKPCGVLAFDDGRAVGLLRLCKELGLQVPHDLHIISVGDTPACMGTTPTLSSISMPFTLIGYHAARLCEKMVNGETVESLQIPPSGLIIRDSIKTQSDDIKTATEIAHYLRMNLAHPIQMEDLERRSSLSARHLARVFSSAYGIPPIAYLKELRLEQAKNMMRSGDAKVKDVAKKCGYRDTNHLCRIFRERVGLSPQAYAQENGKK